MNADSKQLKRCSRFIYLCLMGLSVLASPDLLASTHSANSIDVTMRHCLYQKNSSSTLGQMGCLMAARQSWVEVINQSYQRLMQTSSVQKQKLWRLSQQAELDWQREELNMLRSIYAQSHASISRLNAAEIMLHATRAYAVFLRDFIAHLPPQTQRTEPCEKDIQCKAAFKGLTENYTMLLKDLNPQQQAHVIKAQKKWRVLMKTLTVFIRADEKTHLLDDRSATLRILKENLSFKPTAHTSLRTQA